MPAPLESIMAPQYYPRTQAVPFTTENKSTSLRWPENYRYVI